MDITAKFVGDFSAFYDAVQQAETQLRGFETGAQNVEKQLNRMGDSFSGRTILQEATLATKAVEDIGGVTMLTANEQERLNGMLTEAIAKYAALGQTAPPEMQALADATAHATGGLEEFGKGFNLQDAIEHPLSAATEALKTFAATLGPVGVAAAGAVTGIAAVGVAVYELTDKAAAAGGALQDLSLKTGISVPQLSRLSNAAQVAGTDMESLGNAIYKMDIQAAANPEKFANALKEIGINAQDFFALSPDEKMLALSDALNATSDAATRNAAGQAIMGRGFRDIEAPLMKLREGLEKTSELSVWSPEQAKDADEFEQQMTALGLQVKDVALVIGKELIPVALTLLGLFKELAAIDIPILKVLAKPLTLPIQAAQDLNAAWMLVTGQFGQDLPAAVKTGQDAFDKLAKPIDIATHSADELKKAWTAETKENDAAAAVLKKNAEEWKRVLDEVNSAGNGWKGTLDTIDGAIVDWAKHLLDSGVAAQTVEKYYGLTNTQIKALQDSLKDDKAFDALLLKVKAVEDGFNGLDKQIQEVGKSTSDVDFARTWSKEFDASLKKIKETEDGFYGLSGSIESLGIKVKPAMSDLAGVIDTGFSTTLKNELLKLPDQIASGGFAHAFDALGKAMGHDFSAALITEANKNFHDSGFTTTGLANLNAAMVKSAAGAGATAGALAALGGGSVSSQLMQVAGAATAVGVAVASTATGTIAAGLAMGAWTFGVGAAVVGAVALAKHFLTVSQAEKDARAEFDNYNKAIGGSNVDDFIAKASAAFGYLGTNSETARKEIQAVLDATHVSAQAVAQALIPVNAAIEEAATKAKSFADAMTAMQSTGAANFNAMAVALEGDASSLDALGAQAMTTYATLVAGGESSAKALADIGPGLDALEKSYQDLGINITDAGLSALIMQSTIAKGNPALIAGVDALAASLKTMGDLGLVNADSFAKMQTEGVAMYTRLQDAANAAGGSTADALLPMQDYLHQAADEATKLGIPLDANTQLMIDQSKELGIWKDASKSATDQMIDSMGKLVDKVGTLIDMLTHMPQPDAPWANWGAPPTVPSAPASPPPGYATGGIVQAFASGGNVLPFAPRGTDTVPAMLTPGERVLTQQQQTDLANTPIVLEHTTIVTLDGEVLYRSVDRRQKNDLLSRRKLSAA
jgi:hypothetical protein